MQFITLTRIEYGVMTKFFVNYDKIHFIRQYKGETWINFHSDEHEIKVEQTPEEIIELIKGGGKK